MTFTSTNALANILIKASPNNWFHIVGKVIDTEEQYNNQVIYENPAAKPSWATALAGRNDEQWVVVRSERNIKLQASDWSVLADVPITPEKKTEWETYRQALRDVTNQPDPFNITWPMPPE
jgi:hypothetical protein